MTLLDYLFAAVPMLGTLIFVHELGHFMAAKLCGVRVLKFSLGFGPPIGVGRFQLRWVRSGTEYVVAWFPLGGFVKMLGEQMPGAEADTPRVIDAAPEEYLDAKSTLQKLFIMFAGPGMNLVLPVLAFLVFLWVGTARPVGVIGTVERGSPSEHAGLAAGDRILSVDGDPAVWWDDVSSAVASAPGRTLALEVDRDGESLHFDVLVEQRGALDKFGLPVQVGWIGLGSRRLPTLLGVPSRDSAAARVGLRSGDRVTAVEGIPVEDWESFRKVYSERAAAALQAAGSSRAAGASQAAEATVELEIARGSPPEPSAAQGEEPSAAQGEEPSAAQGEEPSAAQGGEPSAAQGGEPSAAQGGEPSSLTLRVPAVAEIEELGLISATVLVDVLSPGLPAEKAGLKHGDLLLAVDGRPVGSFASFADTVRSSGGKPLEITYARAGVTSTLTIQPELREVKGPLDIEGMTEEIYQIGIQHALATLPGESALDRERNPMRALPRAVEMTVKVTMGFLEGVGKLISGEVGTDKLGGPILIAEIARKSLDRGWQAYLMTMIVISINLGVLNLLPIPILDGGQALIYLIEGVKRSPISLRSRELVQQTGLIVLALLMGLAFWNDLSRHWTQFVEWISTAL